MSSHKNPKGNKNTRKNKPVKFTKTIDDYLNDPLFPILHNEYITIELETCSELKEIPKYNYKVSSIKKHRFTQDVPDYNEYPTLTMETLQEGINNLNLKDSNSFIRLMLISGDEGLKIWKLDNQKYKPNTNNKEKCGIGTSIYEEYIPIAFADSPAEPVVLQPIQNEGFVEKPQEPISSPKILEPDFVPVPVVKPEPEPLHTTAPSQGLLHMIDEIREKVKQTEYTDDDITDDKTEIINNMISLEALVDELDKISTLLTPKPYIKPEPKLRKIKCDTALTYIKNNLYDDYAMVNDKHETYSKSETNNDFEKHKQEFIEELDNFKEFG